MLISESAHRQAQGSEELARKACASMDSIARSTASVSKISALIEDIASKTRMLALNASVEAARAGEMGMGFAVVAAEIRALADQSGQAAQKIKALAAEISTKVAQGSALVLETSDAFVTVMERVAEIDEIVGAIATSSISPSDNRDAITKAVLELRRSD